MQSEKHVTMCAEANAAVVGTAVPAKKVQMGERTSLYVGKCCPAGDKKHRKVGKTPPVSSPQGNWTFCCRADYCGRTLGFLQQPRVHRWDTVHMSHRFRAQVNVVQLHEANIYSAAV